ncbi:hypothetical protein HanIR_Chr02g0062261 [Helianthus annuus]|nr:hypothetical protein HanIR_Chr02g0062261 [Helianthus annuus]
MPYKLQIEGELYATLFSPYLRFLLTEFFFSKVFNEAVLQDSKVCKVSSKGKCYE